MLGGFHPAREEDNYRGDASVADLAGKRFLLEVSRMFWKEGRELRRGGAWWEKRRNASAREFSAEKGRNASEKRSEVCV